jgi:hypothetical protein
MTTEAGARGHEGDLAAAVEACRAALADYEAGLLSDTELRRELYRSGLVRGTDEAWLLDLERGSWQRYDGVSLTEQAFRVRSNQLERWRDVLNDLRLRSDDRTAPEA